MGTDCSLPFCLEDWGFIGFLAFSIVAGIISLCVISALYVRCRFCFDNRGTNGIRYAFKLRSRAEIARQYLGEREVIVPERRVSNSSWRHWDSRGQFTGTSESTTTWYEWVPRRVSVYEHFYECPDCGDTWSQVK